MTRAVAVADASPATVATTPPPADHGLRWPVAAHAAVALLAGFVYFWRLGTADRLVDEPIYAQAGRAYLSGDFALNPEHPLLAKYLIGLGGLVVDAPAGTRLAGALSGLGLTVLLHLLARSVAGWRWGLVAALGWLLLPHALANEPDRFGVPLLDRFGILDPVAAVLAMLALVLGWRWTQAPSVALAALTGAAVGLAASAKLSGVLVAPVIAVAVVAASTRRRRTVVECAVAAAAAVVAYLAQYLPAGRSGPGLAASAVTTQLGHAGTGHRVVLAGEVYERAPWWSHLYFSWRDDGPVVTTVLLVLVVAALAWSGERRLVAYLAGAVVVPLAVLSASPVALPHYRMLWLAPLVLLAVLGLRALVARGGAWRVVAGLACLSVLVVGGQHLGQLLRLGPGAYAGVACAARALDVADGTAVVVGFPAVLGSYLPELEQVSGFPADRTVPLAVLDPKVTSRTPATGVTRELAARRFQLFTGRGLDVYVDPSLATRPGTTQLLDRCGLRPAAA